MHKQPGQSLLEVLIAIAVFVMGFVALSAVFIDSGVTNRDSVERSKGNRLALEGLEAVRSIRDRSFAEVTVGTKGLTTTGGQWYFSGTSDTYDGYSRSIQISAPTADTRFVTSTVTWTSGSGLSAASTFVTVLSNWQAPTAAATTWASPKVVATTTLPFGGTAVADQVLGQYLYVSKNSGSGPEFLVYDISDASNPTYVGGYEVGYNVLAIHVTGTRAYLGTNNSSREVYIVSIANPLSPSYLGGINLGSGGAVTSLKADVNYLHIDRVRSGGSATYLIYNVTNPASASMTDSLNLGHSGNDVELRKGSPPFSVHATAYNTGEIESVNYSNPNNINVSNSINLSGNEDTYAISVSGTDIGYLGSATRNTAQEFYTLNLNNPASMQTYGSYEINANVNEIRSSPIGQSLAFLATSSSTKEFLVMDTSDVFNPVPYGWLNIPNTALDVAVATSSCYIITNNATNAILTVVPGP